MFTAVTAPALVFTVASLFFRRVSRWLCGIGRNREARAILARIGGPVYADAEMVGIESAALTPP